MVFYEMIVKYREEVSAENEEKKDREKKGFSAYAAEINDQLGVECGPGGHVSLEIVGGDFGEIWFIMACNLELISKKQCHKYLLSVVKEEIPEAIEPEIVSEREVGVKDVSKYLKRASRKGFFHGRVWFENELKIDYCENSQFKIREKCYEEKPTREETMKKAEAIMADDSLLEELERIYSEKNVKKYYGNPVHYSLSVGSREAAMEVVDVLVPALLANNRLLGSRVTHLYEIDSGCFNETDVQNIFSCAQGSVVMMELSGSDGLHGNYASSYEAVVRFYGELLEKYGLNTLCIFVNITSHPGFAQSMLAKASEIVDVVGLKEGLGDFEKASMYFYRLAESTDYTLAEEEIHTVLPQKKYFTISDVQLAFKKWYGNGLKGKVYQAYKAVELASVEASAVTSDPYKELQNMVGLAEIKRVVDQIIATGKMEKMRSKMGLDTHKNAMHMVFSGNPGSAKTSVARLLAEILRKEGILESGRFVEVGRADLIARYVGWTAKTVREKFRAAQGGILFIDEAYSLVDGSNSFGDEAINTIVQEMENHRDDVIVIFAGYPKKMEAFLQKNEGLRSRVAFHLNFPDYTAEEMQEILELLCKKNGYSMEEDARERSLRIFEDACQHEEFGNGRFARNLMEQAMMHQAERLFAEYKGKKIGKKQISELKAVDFNTVAGRQYKEVKQIGFA